LIKTGVGIFADAFFCSKTPFIGKALYQQGDLVAKLSTS